MNGADDEECANDGPRHGLLRNPSPPRQLSRRRRADEEEIVPRLRRCRRSRSRRSRRIRQPESCQADDVSHQLAECCVGIRVGGTGNRFGRGHLGVAERTARPRCRLSGTKRVTAGPALGTASCRTKKMPVPTVAPTPSIVSWNVVMLRSSAGPACASYERTIPRRACGGLIATTASGVIRCDWPCSTTPGQVRPARPGRPANRPSPSPSARSRPERRTPR